MKFRLAIVALALMLVAPLVASPTTHAQDEVEALKVGVIMPFTGDLSDFGPGLFAAAEMAAAQINEAGGELAMVQVYTVARQPAESFVSPLPDDQVDAIVDLVQTEGGVPASGFYGVHN